MRLHSLFVPGNCSTGTNVSSPDAATTPCLRSKNYNLRGRSAWVPAISRTVTNQLQAKSSAHNHNPRPRVSPNQMPASPARIAAYEILLPVETQDAYAVELLHTDRVSRLSAPDR